MVVRIFQLYYFFGDEKRFGGNLIQPFYVRNEGNRVFFFCFRGNWWVAVKVEIKVF